MMPPLLSDCQSRSVQQLGEAIADISAGIHAATYQLLVLLREFDERSGWNNGFLSCAHWLSWRTGIDAGAAREKVRVARALPHLPLLSGALQRGEISYAKVRALTRIATPDNEKRLMAVACCGTAAHVERLVRAWRYCGRVEDGRKYLSRSASCWVDEDGMVVLRARLTPEQGAIVQKALEAASDRLYQEGRHAAPPDNVAEQVTYGQRQADALTLMAESALNADLDRGATGDRYQVVLHVEAPPALIDGELRHVVQPAFVAPSRIETATVCFPVAVRGAATRITSSTGWRVVARRSTIWCFCAAATTRWSTTAASVSRGMTARRSSAGRMAGRSS